MNILDLMELVVQNDSWYQKFLKVENDYSDRSCFCWQLILFLLGKAKKTITQFDNRTKIVTAQIVSPSVVTRVVPVDSGQKLIKNHPLTHK